MPVELEVESVDGMFTRTISAFTTDRFIGELRIINWGKEPATSKHLQGIQFPKENRLSMDKVGLHMTSGKIGRRVKTNYIHAYFAPGKPKLGKLTGLCTNFGK